jgi:hypothetical protein
MLHIMLKQLLLVYLLSLYCFSVNVAREIVFVCGFVVVNRPSTCFSRQDLKCILVPRHCKYLRIPPNEYSHAVTMPGFTYIGHLNLVFTPYCALLCHAKEVHHCRIRQLRESPRPRRTVPDSPTTHISCIVSTSISSHSSMMYLSRRRCQHRHSG